MHDQIYIVFIVIVQHFHGIRIQDTLEIKKAKYREGQRQNQ